MTLYLRCSKCDQKMKHEEFIDGNKVLRWKCQKYDELQDIKV